MVLGYGRTPYQEEIECDQLSKDYAPQFTMDMKLRALLGKYSLTFIVSIFYVYLYFNVCYQLMGEHGQLNIPDF